MYNFFRFNFLWPSRSTGLQRIFSRGTPLRPHNIIFIIRWSWKLLCKKRGRIPDFWFYGQGNASSHMHGSCTGCTTRLVKNVNHNHCFGSTYFTFTVSTFMLLILMVWCPTQKYISTLWASSSTGHATDLYELPAQPDMQRIFMSFQLNRVTDLYKGGEA